MKSAAVRRVLIILALIGAVMLPLPGMMPIAHAATTYMVINNNTSGVGSFGQAITDANANPNSTITFSSPFTIALTANLPTITANMIINGAGATIQGGTDIRGLTIQSGTVSIDSLTITQGNCSGGCPIAADTSDGGGIYNTGALTITHSTISDNSAVPSMGGGVGGGIYNDGALTIINTIISGNSGSYGGGIFINGGTVNITDSTLSDNLALPNGYGGGIDTYGTLTVTSSTFSGNHAGTLGGGIINESNSPAMVTNSTFSGNIADSEGGGIFNDSSGTLTVTNSTFSGNSAPSVSGGGIQNNGTLTVTNSIIANSVMANDCSGTAGTFSGLNIADDSSCGTTNVHVTNPVLGSLTNNGGPTDTFALQPGSPAIRAATCTVTVDQRGLPRKTPNCDIGAYETQPIIATNTPTATSTATFTLTPTNTVTPSNTATVTPSHTSTITPQPGRIDSIGVDRDNTFYLRLHDSTGGADIVATLNAPGNNLPVIGDWTGAGFDSIGVLNTGSGVFSLRNTNTCGSADESLVFGNPNDTPLSGRWTATDTHDGIGVYRPTNGILYAKNALSTGYSDYALVLGNPGDQGIAGNWTGLGYDGLGVFRPGNLNFYLVNQSKNGIVYSDLNFQYGGSSDVAIAGDWIAQGHDGVGVFRPSNATVYLKNQLTTGSSDNAFLYGVSTDLPIAGHWQVTYPAIVPQPTARPSAQPGSISLPGGNQIGG